MRASTSTWKTPDGSPAQTCCGRRRSARSGASRTAKRRNSASRWAATRPCSTASPPNSKPATRTKSAGRGCSCLMCCGSSSTTGTGWWSSRTSSTSPPSRSIGLRGGPGRPVCGSSATPTGCCPSTRCMPNLRGRPHRSRGTASTSSRGHKPNEPPSWSGCCVRGRGVTDAARMWRHGRRGSRAGTWAATAPSTCTPARRVGIRSSPAGCPPPRRSIGRCPHSGSLTGRSPCPRRPWTASGRGSAGTGRGTSSTVGATTGCVISRPRCRRSPRTKPRRLWSSRLRGTPTMRPTRSTPGMDSPGRTCVPGQ